MSHRNISEPEKPIKYKIGVKYHVELQAGPGGGHSLIWPRRVSSAEQGLVFRVLSLTQVKQFHYLVS